MKNKEFIEILKRLKEDEGISYKSIARSTGIAPSSFYHYVNNNMFPYTARKVVEEYILKEYKELIEQ